MSLYDLLSKSLMQNITFQYTSILIWWLIIRKKVELGIQVDKRLANQTKNINKKMMTLLKNLNSLNQLKHFLHKKS
jgi:hypothetical protein